MIPIRFLEPAKLELRETIRYYNVARPGLGEEFKEEVDLTLDRIEQFPHAWSRLSKTIRVCQTDRFPYGLIYEPSDQEILIIAVMHLHRRPGYWKKRLKAD